MSDLTSAPCPELRGDDHVRGTATDPLVVIYADLECPRCALAWARLEGAQIRLVFRHFALKTKHPRAIALACAAEAASRQDAFWQFTDALYRERGRIDDPHLWAHIKRLGLDLDRFESDRRDPEVLERVKRDVRDALRAGATATPTLFAGDVMHPGPPSDELVREWSGSDTKE